MKTIPLTQGLVALVDDEDYERVSKYKWHAVRSRNGKIYAVRSVYLHTLVADKPYVDHADGNGLNCQRHNLREATRQQNAANSAGRAISGYKGVRQSKNRKKFEARITVGNKVKYLGMFDDPTAAAAAYDKAAREHFGEFARTNF